MIHSRDRVLSAEPLPAEFQERVGSILREAGVKIIFGQRVLDITAIETEGERRLWKLELADGRNIYAGHVMNAISKSVPTTSYLPEEALTEEGYVKIRASYVPQRIITLTGLTLNQYTIPQEYPERRFPFCRR